jgi:uncharacterized protein YjfI (DUF2170 family)
MQLEEENSAKKQCRMQDNIFINELKQYECYKPMKEISSHSRLRRILPLAYQILGNVINR